MKNRQTKKSAWYCAFVAIALLCVISFISCGAGTLDTKKDNDTLPQKAVIITEADKTVAVEIPAAQNQERGNASGPSITSGAHSDAFPGIVFTWDSKAKDSGYLVVAAEVFDNYSSFTLTTKEGSSYWDFVIKPEADQQKNKDGNYIFFIPRASGGNKINMVFLSEWLEKDAEPGEPVEIIEEEAELVELGAGMLLSSGAMVTPITMTHSDENVVFICSVDNGCFMFTGYPKNTNAYSSERISWISRREPGSMSWGDHAFIEIILKLEQNIIGYVVIEIDPSWEPILGNSKWAVILKSVLFPQVDGEYQSVSEEYVKAAIEKVKDGKGSL